MESKINNPLLQWLVEDMIPTIKTLNPKEFEEAHYKSHDYTENSTKYFDQNCKICNKTTNLIPEEKRDVELIKKIINRIKEYFPDFLNCVLEDKTRDTSDFNLFVFPRVFISSSILDEVVFQKIASFSNGHAISMGAGSGYNEWILSQYGINVYAVDVKTSYFTYKFYDIDCSFGTSNSIEKIKNIFSNNGCAIYCWPFEYYELETLIEYGCKKIVVIGSFVKNHYHLRNGHGENSKPLCPIFDKPGWKKVTIMQNKQYISADPTSVDWIYFWELIE